MSGKRRGLLAAVAAAVVVAVVALAIVRSTGGSSDDESISSAEDGELGFPAPEPEDADADRDYLHGDGRVLLLMHERAQALTESTQLAGAQCEQEAETLDRDAPANEVLSRIGGLADPVLRDAFHAERTALGVALTQCISGEVADDRAPELAEAVEAVEVRLNELGE